MARLEYRTLADGYPVLFYYDSIGLAEVSLRFACDYFVKEGVVYEKTSCAIEQDRYVIYVKRAEDEKAVYAGAIPLPNWQGIRLELRHFREETSVYPVVTQWDFAGMHDVLLYLQSDYLYVDGKEWEKTSTEVDEDRKLYVYYAKEASGE